MAESSRDREFRIRIDGQTGTLPCLPDERVLSALERAFRDPGWTPVRVGCRQGGCGACRIRVIEGRYRAAKMSRAHVSQEDQAEGYVLACRIFAESDLVVEPAYVSPRRRAALGLD